MDLKAPWQRLARDGAAHVLGTPADEADLRRVEEALGWPLPADLRSFLARFGGGLFYGGHEIFGPRRVMIHDIELVPDLLSVRRRLLETLNLSPHLLPIHREGGLVHLLDLRPDAPPPRVRSTDGRSCHADFETFVLAVVMKGLDAEGGAGSR